MQDLGLHAVAVLVLQPHLRLGQPPDALLAVVIEAGRGHAVGAMDDARHVFAPGRAHAVHQAELGAFGRYPFRSLGAVDHVRHALLERRRGVLGAEGRRQPDQVDMAVGGDDVVLHGRDPPGAIIAPKVAPANPFGRGGVPLSDTFAPSCGSAWPAEPRPSTATGSGPWAGWPRCPR